MAIPLTPSLNLVSDIEGLYEMSRKVYNLKNPGWDGRWFEELARDIGIRSTQLTIKILIRGFSLIQISILLLLLSLELR